MEADRREVQFNLFACRARVARLDAAWRLVRDDLVAVFAELERLQQERQQEAEARVALEIRLMSVEKLVQDALFRMQADRALLGHEAPSREEEAILAWESGVAPGEHGMRFGADDGRASRAPAGRGGGSVSRNGDSPAAPPYRRK
jgi:hypothetical protein